jgi:hypothetical protein
MEATCIFEMPAKMPTSTAFYILLISEDKITEQWKEEGEKNGYRKMTFTEEDAVKDIRSMENDK